MSDELQQQVAELARQMEAMGLRVDGLEIKLRTKDFRFSERVALIVTTIVGVIMAIFTILSGINLFYG